MNLTEIKSYLKIPDKMQIDTQVLAELKRIKSDVVNANEESLAKGLWCLEQVYEIQRKFITAFNNLKQGKHFEAWCDYDKIDILFCSLRKHYNYSNNECNLLFIEEYTSKFQKLFPYRFFMSRESIIKKEKCSICGKINSIRNRCEHKVGEIYRGEMCYRIVEEFEFLAMAIVTNPFDKYTVLFPQNIEYNYSILDNLLENLRTSYDRWDLQVETKIQPIYKNIGRNSKCPCDSGKKYKKCCKGNEQETTEHFKIILIDNKNVKPIPYTTVNTWSN